MADLHDLERAVEERLAELDRPAAPVPSPAPAPTIGNPAGVGVVAPRRRGGGVLVVVLLLLVVLGIIGTRGGTR